MNFIDVGELLFGLLSVCLLYRVETTLARCIEAYQIPLGLQGLKPELCLTANEIQQHTGRAPWSFKYYRRHVKNPTMWCWFKYQINLTLTLTLDCS